MSNYFHRQVEITPASSLRRKSVSVNHADHRLRHSTPHAPGQHRIDITFASLPVQGSPFFTEVYDPSQVRIGPLPRDMIVGAENVFEINMDNAGNVPLEIKITSPTGANGKTSVE